MRCKLIKLCINNKDYKIREVPITFEKRKQGKSKRKLGKFILSYIKTMKKLINIRKRITKTQGVKNEERR